MFVPRSKALKENKSIQVNWCEKGNSEIDNVLIFHENDLGTLAVFPENGWKTVLSEEERNVLRGYLPDLRGWKGMEIDDALNENVNQLLSGSNFQFGNPVHRMIRDVAKGKYSEKMAGKVKQEQQVLYTRYLWFMEQREYRLKQQLRDKDDGSKIPECETQSFKMPNKQNSLFLAMEQTLYQTPMKLNKLCSMLGTKLHLFPQGDSSASSKIYIHAIEMPFSLTKEEYIEAAVAFLKAPNGDSALYTERAVHACPSWIQHQGKMLHWQPCGPSDSTAEKLLSMEYVFTMPLDENRITQQIRRWVPKVESSYPTDHGYLPYIQQPSIKKSDIQHRTIVQPKQLYHIMSTIAYQSQETLRYATPNAPFKYSDEYEFGVQHATVAFRLPDSIVLSEDLLSTNNKAVSFTNLVCDTLVRLPHHSGTIGDILCLVSKSQFLNHSASISQIHSSIVQVLDTLYFNKKVPLDFDSKLGLWTFSPHKSFKL